MNRIKLFLDDVRVPKDCLGYMHLRIGAENPIYLEEWVIARNYDEFVQIVKDNFPNISHVSFDHDLADEHYDLDAMSDIEKYNELYSNFKEKTGVDCAEFLKKYYKDNNTPLPEKMYVHSMNPVGMYNIINVFE